MCSTVFDLNTEKCIIGCILSVSVCVVSHLASVPFHCRHSEDINNKQDINNLFV